MRKRIARSLRVLAAVGIGGLLAGPAGAGPLLYLVSADEAQLRVIDAADASTQSTTPLSLAGETIEGATGLARQPGGTLYGLLKLAGQSGRELVTIDPGTGTATSVGDTGLKLAGLAFDASGTLYGINGDQQFSGNPQDPETLFTLSLVDANPTLFQVLGNGSDGETIAFRSDDSLLYHASGTHIDQIFETVDPDTNAVTDIPLSGDEYTEAGALTHGAGGLFYMADIEFEPGLGGDLYTLTDAGVATRIGNLGVLQPKGLVLVPEPGTGLLVALGVSALAAGRRRAGRGTRAGTAARPA